MKSSGFSRDRNSFDPQSPVTLRDRFYREAFRHVLESQWGDTPVSGINFWAWAGEGRPRNIQWRPGDPFTGDPPHEAQGWYSVYDSNTTTLKIISDYARRFRELPLPEEGQHKGHIR